MSSRNPFYFLSLIFLFFSASNIPVIFSLSTISVSKYGHETFVCALIPTQRASSTLHCIRFPERKEYTFSLDKITSVAGGNGFLYVLRSYCESRTQLHAYNVFSNFSHAKRIDKRDSISYLTSTSLRVCGTKRESGDLVCWRWKGFQSHSSLFLSNLVMGDEFVCGLSRPGKIFCFGNDDDVLHHIPNGTFRTISAGSKRVCAISKSGETVCWGLKKVNPPKEERFSFLALGENRICGIRDCNHTVTCWGDNYTLPTSLRNTTFLEITASGDLFCGILRRNYSLICWGDEDFNSNNTIFKRVQPGSCIKQSECECSLTDSDQFCPDGFEICSQCSATGGADSAVPLPPSNTTGSTANMNKRVLLIVGSVGIAIFISSLCCLFIYSFCLGKSCRVHDSGRLDEESASQIPSVLPPQELTPAQSQLQRRLSSSQGINFGCPVTTLKEFSLTSLLVATDNFSQEHKIGSGSYGSVYKGTLTDGQKLAIKRADLPSASCFTTGIAAKDCAFISELSLLSRINHKHLVRLLGYCNENAEKILVYEFMPNGTLHDHLHKLRDSPLCSWVARLEVALDAARGILYLHNYAVPPIIHRDIKSANILLDSNWTAKVSDFGLSLSCPENSPEILSSNTAGTVGYIDPEYYRLQQLTTKTDVYSFGVVLLEILTGLKAIHWCEEITGPRNVIEFAVPYIISDETERILDLNIGPTRKKEIEALKFVAYLAVDCVGYSEDRPCMSEVVNILEQALNICTTVEPTAAPPQSPVESSPLTIH